MERKGSTSGIQGSAELNQEMGTKRHFAHTIDTFSRLIVHPKCICSEGSAPNPARGAYSAPTDSLAGREGARCSSPRTFSPLSGPLSAPNTNSWLTYGFRAWRM